MNTTTDTAQNPNHFDLIVIGAGPGGYEAALKAAHTGMNVCLVEQAALGGTCVNWGCIPTKALLRSADLYETITNAGSFGLKVDGCTLDFPAVIKRSRNVALKLSKGVDFLMRRSKVTVVAGSASFISKHSILVTGHDQDASSQQTLTADHFIVATGARNRILEGLEPDGKKVITSREALILKAPPASLLVVGGGAIGIEMAWFYAMCGTKVTIIEQQPHLLPLEDVEVAEVLRRSFQKAGIDIYTAADITAVDRSGEGLRLQLIVNNTPVQQELQAECMLVAVGVTGNTDDLQLQNAGVIATRGFIVTDSFCRTSVGHIFAIGDVRGGMLLAHKASAEAVIAVETMLGKAPDLLNESKIPRCVYAEPSVASVGFTEEKAITSGYDVKVGRAMFSASGKANAYGHLDGFVKLVFNAADETLLGGHVIGHGAVELIGELSLARQLEVTATRLVKTVHAHPTLSETIREAAQQAIRS